MILKKIEPNIQKFLPFWIHFWCIVAIYAEYRTPNEIIFVIREALEKISNQTVEFDIFLN